MSLKLACLTERTTMRDFIEEAVIRSLRAKGSRLLRERERQVAEATEAESVEAESTGSS